MASVVCPQAFAQEGWVRVESHDKKASVLFPSHPDKVETLSRKSPAGTINTRIARYEREGALLTITGTQLPSVALRFASTDKILRSAVEGVLDRYLGKKVSQKEIKIDGEPAVMLQYSVPDYDDPNHPGYKGTAIAFLVDGTLYVVNSILTRENPQARAEQEKLLGSIRIHK
jgi:hypothetical protein